MATTRSCPGGLRSPPAGAGSRAHDEPVQHTNWTVEERLPLMARGRAAPLALFRVRAGLADAVVCLS